MSEENRVWGSSNEGLNCDAWQEKLLRLV